MSIENGPNKDTHAMMIHGYAVLYRHPEVSEHWVADRLDIDDPDAFEVPEDRRDGLPAFSPDWCIARDRAMHLLTHGIDARVVAVIVHPQDMCGPSFPAEDESCGK